MHRNLDRRVEALVRLVQPDHIKEVSDPFSLAMADTSASWWLDSAGTWTRHQYDESGQPLVDVQDQIMKEILAKRAPRH